MQTRILTLGDARTRNKAAHVKVHLDQLALHAVASNMHQQLIKTRQKTKTKQSTTRTKREELLLRTVLALPNASNTGLDCKIACST